MLRSRERAPDAGFATKRSIFAALRRGLLRGARHRARIRATGWLAMMAGRRLIHEHYGLATVHNHTVFQVIADRACEHATLDIAAFAHEIVGRVAMTDALDVLIDNRSFVEVARDVMRSRADQLHAALMGLMIGLGALESRQEGVMNVDAASRQFRREIVRQDL